MQNASLDTSLETARKFIIGAQIYAAKGDWNLARRTLGIAALAIAEAEKAISRQETLDAAESIK